MFSRYAFLAVSAVLAVVVTIVSLANLQPATLALFGSHFELSFGLVMLAALAVGGLTGFAGAGLNVGQAQGEVRKLEWQAQDAKLAAEVRSDREKQLEAKIATLETALKQALKKV